MPRAVAARARPFVLALGPLVLSVGLACVGVEPARAAPGNDPRPAHPRGRLVLGEDAPPLSAQRIAGPDPVSLNGLAGRVVVLDFWATWCSPCRAVMPVLDAMYQARSAQGLSVIGVSPESDAAIRAHLARNPVHYTVARDLGGTVQSYGVRGIPMLVVVDRGGKVREVMQGVDAATIRRLDGLVTRLLAEPAP